MSISNNKLVVPNTKFNYIIEDDFDFYSELNKPDYDELSEKKCLITGKKLEQNSITLECNHSFNYISLFKEVCHQKKFNINEPSPLRVYEIRCPYCRQITNHILPFIPSIVKQIIKGVNYPPIYCMDFKPCDHIIRQGSHKGDKCNKNGFESIYGNICEKHYNQNEAKSKKLLKKKDSQDVKTDDETKIFISNEDNVDDTYSESDNDTDVDIKNNNNNIDTNWTIEMQELYNCSTVIDIRKKLKEKNLPISGTKKIIIQRLLQH